MDAADSNLIVIEQIDKWEALKTLTIDSDDNNQRNFFGALVLADNERQLPDFDVSTYKQRQLSALLSGELVDCNSEKASVENMLANYARGLDKVVGGWIDTMSFLL